MFIKDLAAADAGRNIRVTTEDFEVRGTLDSVTNVWHGGENREVTFSESKPSLMRVTLEISGWRAVLDPQSECELLN